jgi:uncharacterized protein with GYD domain
MPKYAVFFSYTSEYWNRMIEHPGDRTEAVRDLARSVGGTLESIYWMFGAWDGFLVVDAPSSIQAGGLSVAVGSTGVLRHIETHELLDQGQLHEVLESARNARDAYRRPGE